MPTDNLFDFIQWMVYSGGAILIGSWILERIPAFVAAAPDAKKIISIIVDIVLALGFYAILVFVPVATMEVLAPWFAVAAGTAILYGGGQVVHKLTKPE